MASTSNFRLDSASSETAINDVPDGQIDLVGGPFAVIESDLGVFTSLTRKLGVEHLEIVEVYDMEPWPTDFKDPAAEHVWFANQLSDDASDIRGADNALATAIRGAAKKEKTKRGSNPPPNKRAKTKKPPLEEGDEETYHFTGYVPAYGKVWELDGLKSGSLEVGDVTATTEWMDVVRPALRTKMRKYGGGGDDGEHDIRFSLLAIVDDAYEKASDEWEYWKSERRQLERRLDEG
ncbi:hypothetical protein EV421DRAFT_1914553 [Armillaria borealis]|uniref:ubiquitinyl hydrolase 1 n=1 Tax=Armillaria borealis TaxID=47425 RepID=A0AA39MD82_9AGAR|nr:hypothetical protein EV421DRAFT_1914553 [Armillaria borealis]